MPDTPQQHWLKDNLAYAQADTSEAGNALYRVHDELNEFHPSAAAT